MFGKIIWRIKDGPLLMLAFQLIGLEVPFGEVTSFGVAGLPPAALAAALAAGAVTFFGMRNPFLSTCKAVFPRAAVKVGRQERDDGYCLLSPVHNKKRVS